MNYSPPGSSLHGILQKEYWNGWPFLSPGNLSDPRTEPRSPASQADSLLPEPPEKPNVQWTNSNLPGPYFYSLFHSTRFITRAGPTAILQWEQNKGKADRILALKLEWEDGEGQKGSQLVKGDYKVR